MTKFPNTILVLFLLIVGCSKPGKENLQIHEALEVPAESQPKVFQVDGTVKSIPPNKKQIIINHGEIPGFMRAMTMPFNVGDSAMIAGLKPQDSVHFVITFDGTEVILNEINLVE